MFNKICSKITVGLPLHIHMCEHQVQPNITLKAQAAFTQSLYEQLRHTAPTTHHFTHTSSPYGLNRLTKNRFTSSRQITHLIHLLSTNFPKKYPKKASQIHPVNNPLNLIVFISCLVTQTCGGQ
jgi:hypothetical protein